MDQRGEHRRRPVGDEEADDEAATTDDRVAHKLDRLTSAEAETVIRRALELSDDEKHQDDYGTLDRQTLEVVASELGIPLKHLSRALAEQKLKTATDGDDSWFDRLIRVDELDGAALVKGNIDAVQRALVTWFKTHEGLRLVRSTANRGSGRKIRPPSPRSGWDWA